jgi:serine palmitoyltransferase
MPHSMNTLPRCRCTISLFATVPAVSTPTAKSRGVPANAAPVPVVPPFEFVVSEYVPRSKQLKVRITGDAGVKTTFCSQDFLGLGASQGVRKAATATLDEYSVGSCGPRGFYGTTRAHLDLEECLARFMGTPESITYSDATATIASAIPAFAKRGDLLLMDDGVNHGVHTGARLSRSKLLYFKHNDMSDLERYLAAVADSDRKKHDLSLSQRRFIVVEGLYANYGDICPLRDVVRLARQYKWRIIVDDSLGFGVLGANGRGIVEYAGMAVTDVDVLVGSLSTTLASVGGFCVGSREVVDHQRLSGAGYCFSASAPPFLCAAAAAALRGMEKMPDALRQLHARAVSLHNMIASGVPGLTVLSDPASPVKHLALTGAGASTAAANLKPRAGRGARGAADAPAGNLLSPMPLAAPTGAALRSRVETDSLLAAIVRRAAGQGVLLTRSHFLPTEPLAPQSTLKVYVTVNHSEEDLDAVVAALADAVAAVLADAGPSAVGAGDGAGAASAPHRAVRGAAPSDVRHWAPGRSDDDEPQMNGERRTPAKSPSRRTRTSR